MTGGRIRIWNSEMVEACDKAQGEECHRSPRKMPKALNLFNIRIFSSDFCRW